MPEIINNEWVLEPGESLNSGLPDVQMYIAHRANDPARKYLLRIHKYRVADEEAFKKRINQLYRVPGKPNEQIIGRRINEQIIGHGILADGRAWIVTDLVGDLSLREFRANHAGAFASYISIIGEQIVNALSFAHEKGICSYNLLMENIYLMLNGVTAGSGLCENSVFVTNYHPYPPVAGYYSTYAQLRSAPEVLDRRGMFGAPGQASDIFQLATMLHELETGGLPLSKETRDAILLEDPYIAIRGRRGEVLGRALMRDPQKRPQNIDDFWREWLEAQERDRQPAQSSGWDISSLISRRSFLKGALVIVGIILLVEGMEAIGAVQHAATTSEAPADGSTAADATPTLSIDEGSPFSLAILSSSGELVELVTANPSGLLTIRSIKGLKLPQPDHTFSANPKTVGLAFSEDNRYLLACDATGGAILWNLETYSPQKARLAQKTTRALAWSSQALLVSEDGDVLIFEHVLDKFKQTAPEADRRYIGPAGTQVNSLATGANGLVAAAYTDGMVRLFSSASPETTRATYEGHNNVGVLAVAIGADGSLAASADEKGRVQIWKTASPEQASFTYQHAGPVHTLAWSPDGAYIASGGDDKLVKIYNAVEGKLVTIATRHTEPLVSLAWVDNTHFLSASATEIFIWSVKG